MRCASNIPFAAGMRPKNPKLFYLSGYDKCMKWSRVDIHPLNMPSGYQTPLSILHYGQWFLLVRLPNSEDGRQQFIAFKR
jgi:hypothetical protein